MYFWGPITYNKTLYKFIAMGAAGNKKPKKPGKKHEAAYLKEEQTKEMQLKNKKHK